MGTPKLETLFLTEDNLRNAKRQIEQLAMSLWQAAGCPDACERDFWTEAHQEWIAKSYVPDVRPV